MPANRLEHGDLQDGGGYEVQMSGTEIELSAIAGGVSLAVRVVPGASRTRVVGAHGRALKIAVAAPPEGGKANDQVIAILAELFGRRRGDVTLVRGRTQRTKGFQIAGISVVDAQVRVAKAISE